MTHVSTFIDEIDTTPDGWESKLERVLYGPKEDLSEAIDRYNQGPQMTHIILHIPSLIGELFPMKNRGEFISFSGTSGLHVVPEERAIPVDPGPYSPASRFKMAHRSALKLFSVSLDIENWMVGCREHGCLVRPGFGWNDA